MQNRRTLFTLVALLVVCCLGPETVLGRAPAAPTATISGTIRHAGSPVEGVNINVIWEGGSETVITGSDGVYNVASVPTGGWVNVHVNPPVTERLAFRNWRADALSGDLVKDFDLVSGYRFQGEFRDPGGALYAETFWLGLTPATYTVPPGEWLGITTDGGAFDVVLPPDIYRLVIEPRPMPYFLPHTGIDLRSADLTGLSVALSGEIPAPFPITPPDVSEITVGAPDASGVVTVTGAAGAVGDTSPVIVVNLSARNFATTTASAEGAFDVALYAPPGSTLLVRYEAIGGRRIRGFWIEGQTTIAGPTVQNLNPLPGAMLRVGDPPAGDENSQSFHSVGSFIEEGGEGWAGWWMSGTLQVPPDGGAPGLGVQPGQTLTLTARLRVNAPAIQCSGTPTPTVGLFDVGLRYLFDVAGRALPWGIWFNAHLFTPTGLPIEHEAGGELRLLASGGPLDAPACLSDHVFEGGVDMVLTVPPDMPPGVYRLGGLVVGNVPRSSAVPAASIWYLSPGWVVDLPSIRVGEPATPRIPWTLLANYPVNGHRGVVAREDAETFGMTTRVLFPPHTLVIPRLDERTGEPLVYRLEPEANWLSGTERRLPPPPHLPLDLPGGALTAEVHKPDGSVDVLGPVPVAQTLIRTPTTPGGNDIDEATGQLGDVYQLYTGDEAFGYSFDQYGPHVIALSGHVEDIYGNTYPIQATYDVVVARILDLDPAQLPTTPYAQGDAFAPGLHVFPPVPAQVTVRLVHMPESDPGQAITHTVTGQANRFGYFQPSPGTEIRMTAPGEFRVDYTAVYTAEDGTLWAGSVTWGNVVAGPTPMFEAHGRRGMDYKSNTIDDMPAWFIAKDLPPDKVGVEVYYPYFSGDVHWGGQGEGIVGDSIHTILTVKDLTGGSETIYNLLRDHLPRATSCFRWPPEGCDMAGLEKRIDIGEAPLFITTRSGVDAGVTPEDIDLWGYWYGSSERPDVHVRELLSEDGMGTAYWRFDDTYGYQIGEPADGDQTGDMKWEFGGLVVRTITETNPLNEYAIYSSFWVLLPPDDAEGTRVTPPFQDATGASVNGGPLMTLLGEEIDMLFLPKGVRPGDVLEVGDVVAFSGHVGPPLDSRVSVTITAPSGTPRVGEWHANEIGWLYDPAFDFAADEVGRWTVEVRVLHDRPYVGNGITPQSHNAGTVLGTSGQYSFYVVDPAAARLRLTAPDPGFVAWGSEGVAPIHITGVAPAGATTVHYTIHDKGIVMGQGTTTPDAGGTFTVTYDAETLHASFPMLSLTAREGRWEGLADEVAIDLLAVGGSTPRGNTVTLIGEEVFIQNDPVDYRGLYLPVILRQG